MGKPTGFMEIPRHDRTYAPVQERIQHYREFVQPLPETELRQQGARCMDCGTPFCSTHSGCTASRCWVGTARAGKLAVSSCLRNGSDVLPVLHGGLVKGACLKG